MALTTSQLTFHDISDGEISFSIFLENIDSKGCLNLRAVLTEYGEDTISTGVCQWYKYNNSTGNFDILENAQGETLNIEYGENDIYRCDFSYDLSDSSNKIVSYSAYFNVTTRRMIYLSRPEDGLYMMDDLWIVGDDFVRSDGDPNETIYKNTILKAVANGNGSYNSAHWTVAVGYEGLINDLETRVAGTEQFIKDNQPLINDFNSLQDSLKHKLDLSPEDGLIIRSTDEDGNDAPFKSIFASTQLTFQYNGNNVAWISGDDDTTDSHPQFYVKDAMIQGNMHVTNNFTIGNPLKEGSGSLTFQPENNGSFSILISK